MLNELIYGIEIVGGYYYTTELVGRVKELILVCVDVFVVPYEVVFEEALLCKLVL